MNRGASCWSLLLLLTTFAGCSAPRHAARYTWLNKQGVPPAAKQAPERQVPQAAVLRAATASPASPKLLAIANTSTGMVPTASVNGAPGPAQFPARTPLQNTRAPLPLLQALPPADPDTSYYNGEDRHWNAKAIAALPVAVATVVIGITLQSTLILLIGGAIAFTLGLIGSRQCRDRKNRGKGFAIAGMALGAAALFLSIVALILAA